MCVSTSYHSSMRHCSHQAAEPAATFQAADGQAEAGASLCSRRIKHSIVRNIWQDRRVQRAGKLCRGLARLSAWYSKLRDTRFIRNASTCAAATVLMHSPPKVHGAGCALRQLRHRKVSSAGACMAWSNGGYLLQRRRDELEQHECHDGGPRLAEARTTRTAPATCAPPQTARTTAAGAPASVPGSATCATASSGLRAPQHRVRPGYAMPCMSGHLSAGLPCSAHKCLCRESSVHTASQCD